MGSSRPSSRANLGLVQGGRLGRSGEWRRREEWSRGVEDCVYIYIPRFPSKLFELLRGAPISHGFYQLDAFLGALCTIFPLNLSSEVK